MQGRSERVQCLGVDTEGISISVDKGLNLLPSLALSLSLSLSLSGKKVAGLCWWQVNDGVHP